MNKYREENKYIIDGHTINVLFELYEELEKTDKNEAMIWFLLGRLQVILNNYSIRGFDEVVNEIK